MRQHRAIGISASLFLALTLAACGSSSSSATTTAPSIPTTSTVPDPSTTDAPAQPSATATTTTDIATSTSTSSSTVTSTVTTVEEPAGPATVDELLDLGRPIVLAHGGGEDERPHSTPFAYAESVRAGVDMLDFDVQLTADGVLVVQHDDDVSRTTNGTGLIADMTYAQLSTLDNAYWFTTTCTCTGQPDDAYLYRGIRTGDRPAPAGYGPDDFVIPRFADIAQRFPDLPLNIEIKGDGDAAIAAAQELATELTDLGRLQSSVVTSFDDAVVSAFAGFAPGVELTPATNAAAAWVLSGTPLPAGMRILQLPPVFGAIDVLSPEVIAASHAAGYVIWVWPNDRTLENPTSYDRFLADGIDGLNINFPADGVAAVARFEELAPTT